MSINLFAQLLYVIRFIVFYRCNVLTLASIGRALEVVADAVGRVTGIIGSREEGFFTRPTGLTRAFAAIRLLRIEMTFHRSNTYVVTIPCCFVFTGKVSVF